MTLDERIAAIADKLPKTVFGGDLATKIARELLSAALPELFSDPPTGWIAPVELPDELWYAGVEELSWNKGRNAYLGRHPMKPIRPPRNDRQPREARGRAFRRMGRSRL